MAEKFSLKDHLFNAETVGQLAREYSGALPAFDADRFAQEALAGFAERELMQRLEWLADCIERQLPQSFAEMAEQLEAAMPPPLDPSRTDDDFGHFIHAVPGILAVRHGLEENRDRALDLLHTATKRFSMEFYIRPFLNRWPEQTLDRLRLWAQDKNYHVRRLVSEGTRPKLPWAKAVTLRSDQTLPLLDRLQGDPTRYVTRSVANHLNDIAKSEPDQVLDRLETWREAGAQSGKELDWMTRHALRTLIKDGHPRAMKALGYDPDAAVTLAALDVPEQARIGDVLAFSLTLQADVATGVLVDYVLWRRRSDGGEARKIHKLKQARIKAGETLRLSKSHWLKGDATTFKLYPGPHRLEVQVNGRVLGEARFELIA